MLLQRNNNLRMLFRTFSELPTEITTIHKFCSTCMINTLSAKPTKWSNTLKQFADELFECVRPFCEIGTYRVKRTKINLKLTFFIYSSNTYIMI